MGRNEIVKSVCDSYASIYNAMSKPDRDTHDIKQQHECLNETLTVLPDALTRLQRYTDDLRKFFADAVDEEDVPDELPEDADEEIKHIFEAKSVLKSMAEITDLP